MEFDPFDYREPTPEKRRSIFDSPETEPLEQTPEKPKPRWLFEDKPETEPKPRPEKTKEEEEPEQASDKDIDPTSDEFQELPLEQKKYILAKREIRDRSESLENELAAATPASVEALQIAADLALINALAEKLEHPEQDFEDEVEAAYEQIMDRLDEILAPEQDEVTKEPEGEEDEPAEVTVVSNPKAKPKKATLKARRPQPKAIEKPLVVPRASGLSSQAISGPSGPSANIKTSPGTPSTYRTPEQPTASSPTPEVTTRPERPHNSVSEVRKRRAGELAVSEALTQMLGRRYEQPAAVSQPISLSREAASAAKHIERTLTTREQSVREKAASVAIASIERTRPIAPSSSYEQRPTTPLEPLHLTTHNRVPQQRPETPAPLKPETKRNLQQASTEELLQLGDRITVDGVSLRDLYARNEIDRKGLSKIIGEALKGGDVKSALKKVRLGEEAKRGRRIEMRHDDPKQLPFTDITTDPAAHTARSNQLLEALHAVQRTTQSSTGERAQGSIPTKQAMSTAVTKQRRAAQISIAAIAALGIIGATLAFLFIG